jgi:hypothetical protein
MNFLRWAVSWKIKVTLKLWIVSWGDDYLGYTPLFPLLTVHFKVLQVWPNW